jgi:RNA polymerase sigma-70 factor (ECF subfamily)
LGGVRFYEVAEVELQGTDPDVELMLAFRAGDDSAFDGLFRRWAGPLLRYLERMVGDTATAEELVQETFFRVHGARDRYEVRARFSTWLYRIATNLALNELSRSRRRHPHDEQDAARLPSVGPGVEEVVESMRVGDQVERELARLPERQRIALWLSAAEGQSYAEIALVLETSEKSVKALVHRGRAALVERLGGRGIGPARRMEAALRQGRS